MKVDDRPTMKVKYVVSKTAVPTFIIIVKY